MADITIVGLGILNVDHITHEAERAIRAAKEVFYLDTGVATRSYLEGLSPKVTPLFETSYSEGGHRLKAYHQMAASVLAAALEHQPVCFALQGHPVVGATAPALVKRLAPLLDLEVVVLPGISAMDCIFAELMLDPVVEGLQNYEATDLLLRRRQLQNDVPLLIWQVGTLESRMHSRKISKPERFYRFRDYLRQFYPPDHPVAAIYAAPHPLMTTRLEWFPLAKIAEKAEDLHLGATLYLPPANHRPVQDRALLELIDSPEHLKRITR
jgi:uncharacterized protein YabN with tetrapyrrole methylase and pyrophosphatase domain